MARSERKNGVGACLRAVMRGPFFLKKSFMCLLLALLLMSGVAPARAEEAAAAQDYSKQCSYRFHYSSALRDNNKATVRSCPAGSVLPVSWAKDIPVRYVFIAFEKDPVPFTLTQYDENGVLLKTEPGRQMLNYAYALEENSASLEITVGEKEMVLSSLFMYGEGTVPDFHPFEEPEGKLDFMLVSTHPDDDVIFLGAIGPIYGAERNKTGAIVYLACSSRMRMDEALNGAWAMGFRIHPVFAGFQDVHKRSYKAFPPEQIELFLVRQFRKNRPDVVMGQDVEGEYGHWQHKVGVECLQKAVILAADASYDPDSAAQYGPWQVKKLYLHLYPENTLTLDIQAPLSSMGGRSALEAAQDAFLCHKSQSNSKHGGKTEGVYDRSLFGLACSAVGPDTPGVNDMFENIE